MNDNRDKIPESLRLLHLRQTGLTGNTAQANYVVPGKTNSTLGLYQESLNSGSLDGADEDEVH